MAISNMAVKEETELRRILSKTYPVIGNSDGHPLNEGYKILDVPIENTLPVFKSLS